MTRYRNFENCSLAETIKALRAEGYTLDFNLSESDLSRLERSVRKDDDDFVIDQVHRFDVMTDPSDQSVLYAIHSTKTGAKGLLVNGYGIYSDSSVNQKAESIHRPDF
jgi:hypothetical protein